VQNGYGARTDIVYEDVGDGNSLQLARAKESPHRRRGREPGHGFDLYLWHAML